MTRYVRTSRPFELWPVLDWIYRERFHTMLCPAYWRLPKKIHFIWVKVSQCISNKTTDWGHRLFLLLLLETGRTAILRSHPCKSLESLSVCRAKAIPSFLSYFKTLSIGQTPGIEPATSRSAVKRSTDCANPAAITTVKWRPCWCPKPFLLE